MTILVLGAKGMLGSDCVEAFSKRGWTVVGLDRETFDVTDPMASARLISGEFGKPDWIVNCAAYTKVDQAESEETLATAINGLGPGYVSKAAGAIGARFLQVSTDFVFDGLATEPYEVDARPNPLSAYGRSKLLGEEEALAGSADAVVVRTSWLFGANGPCFPRTMIRAFEAGKPLRVVSDQIGCPTSTLELARVLADLIALNPPGGIYHACGSEAMSWHVFAERALTIWARRQGAAPPNLEAISTEAWPTPATRPKFSVLSTQKIEALDIAPMAPLQVALEAFCDRMALD